MSKEAVCKSLGTTPAAVEESAERVDEWVTTLDNAQSVQTSADLPSGKIHLHQLVVDTDGEDFVVTKLDDETLELTKIHPPVEHDTAGFGKTYVLSYGELAMGADPQYAGTGEPIWAY